MVCDALSRRGLWPASWKEVRAISGRGNSQTISAALQMWREKHVTIASIPVPTDLLDQPDLAAHWQEFLRLLTRRITEESERKWVGEREKLIQELNQARATCSNLETELANIRGIDSKQGACVVDKTQSNICSLAELEQMLKMKADRIAMLGQHLAELRKEVRQLTKLLGQRLDT